MLLLVFCFVEDLFIQKEERERTERERETEESGEREAVLYSLVPQCMPS